MTHTTEKLLHIEDNISKIEEMIVRLTNIRAESEEIQEMAYNFNMKYICSYFLENSSFFRPVFEKSGL